MEVTINEGSIAQRRFVIVHNLDQEPFDKERRDDIVAETEWCLAELGDLKGELQRALRSPDQDREACH